MSTPAVGALQRAGVPFTLHRYTVDRDTDGSYGEAVAAALAVDPARVFKTLIATVDGEPLAAIVPAAGTLSLKALAAARSGKRAAMADGRTAERLTGYVTGGISPFGQQRRLPTIVDASATRWETVYVSAGKRGLQLEIAPPDLLAVTGAAVAAIGAE